MSEIAQLLELLKNAGPYALFIIAAFAWKLERQERINTQESFRDMMAEGIKAMNGTENALRELRRLFPRTRHESDVD